MGVSNCIPGQPAEDSLGATGGVKSEMACQVLGALLLDALKWVGLRPRVDAGLSLLQSRPARRRQDDVFDFERYIPYGPVSGPAKPCCS
jgi:hypothetical protein